MSTQTRALYHDGKLYLDDLLPFPNGTPVVVTVGDIEADEMHDNMRHKIHEVLVAAKLVRPGPVPQPTASTLSPERAAELAKLFGQGGALSDLIHDERDEAYMSQKPI